MEGRACTNSFCLHQKPPDTIRPTHTLHPDIISPLSARLEIWHLYIRRCIHPHHTFSSDISDTTLHHTPPHPPFPSSSRVARPTSSNMYMVFYARYDFSGFLLFIILLFGLYCVTMALSCRRCCSYALPSSPPSMLLFSLVSILLSQS